MATEKNPAEKNLEGNAPEGIQLSDAEIEKARKEGAKEDVKESAKDAHRALTDGNLPGEPADFKYHGYDEIQQYAYVLNLGLSAIVDLISKSNKENPIPDNKIYGLLALERNGQNRTEIVRAMMKRLGLKADELPGGGPDYTNDMTAITDL